jgi:hypothetical protein
LNWQLVKDKAVEMAEEMAYKIPELKDKLHFPRGPNDLYHVAPIGLRYICARGIVASLFHYMAFAYSSANSWPAGHVMEFH